MRRHGVFFVYELLCSVQTKTRIFCSDTIDKLVQSQKAPVIVIPVKTGIQENHPLKDSRFRGSDGLGDFLRDHHYLSPDFFGAASEISSGRIVQSPFALRYGIHFKNVPSFPLSPIRHNRPVAVSSINWSLLEPDICPKTNLPLSDDKDLCSGCC